MIELFITFACIGILVGVSVASYKVTSKFLGWIGKWITKISIWLKNKRKKFVEFPYLWYYKKYQLPKLKEVTKRDNGDEAIAAIAKRVKEATPKYWKDARDGEST